MALHGSKERAVLQATSYTIDNYLQVSKERCVRGMKLQVRIEKTGKGFQAWVIQEGKRSDNLLTGKQGPISSEDASI
jgi:hypothetical protein